VGQKVKNIIPEGFAERLIVDGTRSATEALAQHIGRDDHSGAGTRASLATQPRVSQHTVTDSRIARGSDRHPAQDSLGDDDDNGMFLTPRFVDIANVAMVER
jgi:hypothetical protein